MKLNRTLNPLKHLKDDLPAGLVVFLVAMPLCLGIAMASGAPLYSGLISGIIGGILVGAFSGSPLGVSGPAAGLAVIVLNAITDLGGFEIFLVAVILAGIIQLIMGFARAGIIAYYFPTSVIHGMLAGIGIIIFLKQIPHAFGYDADPEGDFEFAQVDGHNTFEELWYMFQYIEPGVLLISIISLLILIVWETSIFKKLKFTKLVQGPLVAVVTGVTLAYLFQDNSNLQISTDHMVQVPIPDSFSDFLNNFTLPDFSGLLNPQVYKTAIFIAIVASLETLLCVEASDKQDPMKRVTPTNHELKIQGIGNIVAGLIGGLPITQVIVRSSANQQSGGKTKASTVSHGILLLISIIFIPHILNMIPLAVLAAILLVVGYKLAKPSLFTKMYREGMGQFVPFMVTVLGIVFTDLLVGIGMGLTVGIFIILRNNYKVSYTINRELMEGSENFKMVLAQDVSFLNKAAVQRTLTELPNNSKVEINALQNHYIHRDVIDIIEDFKVNAKTRGIEVTVIGLYDAVQLEPMPHHVIIEK